MSNTNNYLPIIAITSDEGPNSDFDAVNNIEEIATDVEDIYFQAEKRKKRLKKHSAKKDIYATDIEDLEGSDDDIVAPIIKHTNPISISDIMLEDEIPIVKESYKCGKKFVGSKPKLKSQISVSVSAHFLQPDDIESYQVNTDLEDFDESDYEEDEVSDIETSDTDLLKEITHESGSIAISDNVRKFLQAIPSPMNTPSNVYSDNEFDDESCNSESVTRMKNISRQYIISPASMSPHLSDITDTEIIEYESNDEVKGCKQKQKCCTEGRRHTLPQNMKLDTTDSEDLDVSENEMIKNRRITVSNLSKTTIKQLKTQRRTQKNKWADLNNMGLSIHEFESDDERNSILYPNKKYTTKKYSKILLKVQRDIHEGATDTEYVEGDDTPDEIYSIDDKAINISNEMETSNAVTEEKMCMKQPLNFNNAGEIRMIRKHEKLTLVENETDEENYGEINESERYENITEIAANINVQFVYKRPTKEMKKNISENKLYIPSGLNKDALTDVEDLYSTDDESGNEKEIPYTVVSNEFISHETDSESMESEAECKGFEEAPDSCLPTVSRKLTQEKEISDNVSKIVSTSITEDSDSFLTDFSNIKTDIEEFSGDEIDEDNFADQVALELDFVDDEKIQYKDTIKILPKVQNDEYETDIEDINFVGITKSSRRSKKFILIPDDDTDKLTDVEDIVFSDKENAKDDVYLERILVDNVSNSKTDVEDFETSDIDQEGTDRECCKTPDILRDMGGETVCSQEGTGHFSLQDMKSLNAKHRSMSNQEVCPSPTLADEIITSADDENCSLTETAIPVHMIQEIDEDSSNKIHSQTTTKFNIEAEDDVMYLKGGGFMLDTFTDTEDTGVSDEENFSEIDKIHGVLLNKMCLSINSYHIKHKFDVVHDAKHNSMSVSLLKTNMVHEEGKKGTCNTSKPLTYLLEKFTELHMPEVKIYNTEILITLAVHCSKVGYKTKISIRNVPSYLSSNITMFYMNCSKLIEIKHETYCSTYDFGMYNLESDLKNSKTIRSKSLIHGQKTNLYFGTDKIPFNIRLRSDSVSKLITKYERTPKVKLAHGIVKLVTDAAFIEPKSTQIKGKSKEISTCSSNIETYLMELRKLNRGNISVNKLVPEKAKHFEKLMKSEMKIIKLGRIILQDKEWGPTKGTSSAGERAGVELTWNAAQQDTGAARLGYIAGNQRSFAASCSKPNSSKSHPSTHATHSNTQLSSYTQLDKILDHMLAEVDEQERLVQLDVSEKLLNPVCVNSLKLVPATDAVIEISISQITKSPKLFESIHEIVLDDNVEQFSDEYDLDDECSLKTLNRSQDSDSLFSFESMSEMYFTENMANKYIASSESLGELEPNNISSEKQVDDEHVYETIEPKNDYKIISPETHDNNKQEIWWEGTYRDLSIVPEEDEDNLSEISEVRKYITEPKTNIPRPVITNDNKITEISLNDDNYDNISYHSSSEISQTTCDEYDTSDLEHNILSNKPVKAEVKLLVKTTDKGREDIEIRTVRDFIDNKNIYKSTTGSTKKDCENDSIKPTYTLQRLFVRGVDNTSVYKEMSKNYPELIAASNIYYPLQYQHNKVQSHDVNAESASPVDLFANTPFYPCYSSFEENSNVSNPFPTAYCDWLSQPDVVIGGKTTSPTILASNEDKVVTGESIINDIMSKDIKPVIDQTKAFIRMESQPESVSACVKNEVPSQQTVKSPVQDKADKEIDNKKEKNKSKGGFFSSLKSFVGRSFDSSDSESKEEKTPKKKKKKDKSTPKKGKKTKDDKTEESETNLTGKVQISSPEIEKTPKALFESNGLNNIPAIDEIEINVVQVTDLDAEPFEAEDVQGRAEALVDTVIYDSQKAATSILHNTIQEFNLEGTVTPEEVRRSTEPIIINEDEFLVVIEPKLVDDYEDILVPDEKIITSPAKDEALNVREAKELTSSESKSDTSRCRKSTGFLKLFGKKELKETEEEGRSDSEINAEKVDHKQDEHRKSTGFFGIFSKKSKEDEKKEANKDIILKEEPGIHYSKEGREFSKDVQQQMLDSSHFLMREVELFEDVRPNYAIDNFKLEQDTQQSVITEKCEQSIITTAGADKQEVGLVENYRPQIKQYEPEINKGTENFNTETCKTENITMSPIVQQQMVDTAHFLLKEQELFDDVKIKYEIKEMSHKTEQAIVDQNKIIEFSEEVQQQIVDTADFLLNEVEFFEDVRPNLESISKTETELNSSISLSAVKEHEIATDQVTTHITEKEIVPFEDITKSPQKKQQTQDTELGETRHQSFFSKLGFGSKSLEKKDDAKEKKKQKKKKDKKSGFFSKFGEKFSSSSQEDKSNMSSDDDVKLIEMKDMVTDLDKIQDKSAKNIEVQTDIKTIVSDSAECTKYLLNDTTQKYSDGVKNMVDAKSAFLSNVRKEADDSVIEARNVGSVIEKDSTSEFKVKIRETVYDATEGLMSVTESTVEKAKGIVENINEIAETNKNNGELRIYLEKNVKEPAKEANDTLVAGKETVEDKPALIKYGVRETADKTIEVLSDVENIIKDTSYKSDDSAVTSRNAEVDIRDSTKESIYNIEKSIQDSLESTADSAVEKVEEVVADVINYVKTSSGHSGEPICSSVSDLKDVSHSKDEIKKTVKDAENSLELHTESLISDIGSEVEKFKDITVKVNETLTEPTEKIEDFFSGLGKNVKESTKVAKDEFVSVTESSKEKFSNITVLAKDSVHGMAEETSAYFNDVKMKTKDASHEAKDNAIAAKDSVIEAATETIKGVKDATNKSKDKTKDTKEKLICATDSAAEKMKEKTGDVKDTAKVSAEKTGGFFSSFGKILKGSAKEVKDELVLVTESGKEKLKDTTIHVDESTKDSTVKASAILSDIGDKINEASQDAKDSAFAVKDFGPDKVIIEDVRKESRDKIRKTVNETTGHLDSGKEKVRNAVEDVKETAKESAEKIDEYYSGVVNKIKGITKNAKDELFRATESTSENVNDKISDGIHYVTDSSVKMSALFSDVGDKTQNACHEAKDVAVTASIASAESVKEIKDASKVCKNNIKQTVIDAKKSFVSPIDSGIEKVKDSKEYLQTAGIESVENTGVFHSDLIKKIKGSTKEGEDDVVIATDTNKEKLKDASAYVYDTRVTADQTPTLITDTEDKINDVALEAKDSVNIEAAKIKDIIVRVDTKESKDPAEKSVKTSGTLFSEFGQKIQQSALDTKDELCKLIKSDETVVSDSTGHLKDDIKDLAAHTSTFKTEIEDKIKNNLHAESVAVQSKFVGAEKIEETTTVVKDATRESIEKTKKTVGDVEESILSATDCGVENVKNITVDFTDTAKETFDKADAFVINLGKNIKRSAKDELVIATESGTGIFKNTFHVNDSAKDLAGISSRICSDVEDKFNARDSAVADKSIEIERFKEAFTDVEETTKEFKDNIKETAKNAKEILSVTDYEVAKIEGVDGDGTLQETAEKTGGFFSDLSKKMKRSTRDRKGKSITFTETGREKVKASAVAAKSMGAEKVKEIVTDAKDATKESKDKIKETVKDVKESLVSAKDSSVNKVNDLTEDIKDAVKQSAENTREYVSDLGKKIQESAKEANKELVIATESSKEKFKDTTSQVKGGAEDSAEKNTIFLSDVGNKIKDIAHEEFAKDLGAEKVKDTVIDVKDEIKEIVIDAKEFLASSSVSEGKKVKEETENVKDIVKESAEKTSGFFSGLSRKIKGSPKKVKGELVIGTKPINEISHVIGGANNTVEKTSKNLSEVAHKSKDALYKAKNSAIAAKEIGAAKIEENVTYLKEETIESKDKIKETIIDAKDSLLSATESEVEAIKCAAKDFKNSVKESAKKTSELFSGTGQKVEESIVEAKEELVIATESGKSKIKDISNQKDDIKDSADKSLAFLSEAKDSAVAEAYKVVETAKVIKVASNESKDKIIETINDAKKDVSGADAGDQIVKNVVGDVKHTVKESVDKTEDFLSHLEANIKESVEDVKDALVVVTESSKETVEYAKKHDVHGLPEKISVTIGDARDKTKDAGAKQGKKSVTHVKDISELTSDKLIKTAKDTKESLGLAADSGVEIAKDLTGDVKKTVKKSAKKAGGFFSGLDKNIEESMKEKFNKTITSIKDNTKESEEKIKETSKEQMENLVSDTVSGVKKIKDEARGIKDSTEKCDEFCSGLENILKDSAKATKGESISTTESDNAKDAIAHIQYDEKVESVLSDTGDKIKSTSLKTEDSAVAAKHVVTENTDKKLSNNLQDNTGVANKSDFICFVTTPTMQRKGIGGSQRLAKDERPPLMDVSNMHMDSSSEEDEYIVTEPSDRLFDENKSSRGSSIIIESIPECEEREKEEMSDSTLNVDIKRRPLFHIGSRDEESLSESVELGDKSETQGMHFDSNKTETETNVTTFVQSDMDLIEDKLLQLGKALDDLEKVNIDFEPQETNTDDKNERKLRRVERRFERMASETMENDIKEAKEKQMTSPEIEAKREDEFRTIVSQLSQEEVSECQNIYTSLWDDATFTPTEEWDSKTPDSQPDDIQELPAGEVVYMGPVTLNKDHLVNAAGIQVDVIPIKRSPCTSPLPKRKLINKGRAKSAMGFYKDRDKPAEERGSLPDLQNTGKIKKDVKLDIHKGSIMSAILKSNPNILKDNLSSHSSSSVYFNTFDNDNLFARRKSTESLTKGVVVTAVKEWMAKSTPFGSTENIRSTDAISLADTLSIFDDDDNDSVDLQSDSVYQFESESSKSDNHIPDIYISNDNLISSKFYDKLQYVNTKQTGTDFGTTTKSLTERVLSAIDQFGLGETSCGPLTNITSEVSSVLITNLDQPSELKPIPKPKPRIDKTPDSTKLITTTLDIEKTETINLQDSDTNVEDISETYSDKKKFWENVTSSKKDDELHEVPIKKRMSLYEEQMYKQDQEISIAKKRTSVHDIGIAPPVPKPRSTVSQTSSEEQPINAESQLQDIKEIIDEKSEPFMSEYKAAFKDPTSVNDQSCKISQDEFTTSSQIEQKLLPQKTERMDSESEYLKYEHQAYENPGYISESDQELELSAKECLDPFPKVKRRQMSISQPPVAAARKTIFERSLSLPTEDLKDVSEKSVKARKQYFEQQIKNEMVIDQLMTQLEEEELQEYKTLTNTTETCVIKAKSKTESVLIGVHKLEKDFEMELKDVEKKLSSSSSQETKTEDDITQYTPTSVKNLAKYFQPNLGNEFTPCTTIQKDFTESKEQGNVKTENSSEEKSQNICTDNESLKIVQQSSTESEQSISSERSIELGSADELSIQIADLLQYKSDSISKQNDSLEVHFDKSEIEDSEKGTDIEQDGTDFENKSFSAEECLADIIETETKACSRKEVQAFETIGRKNEQIKSPLKEHKEQILDTTWEVSIQSQPMTEITESVTEIPIERQIIVERDEELSGSVREESDLGSEIHQDHSESYESERVRSEHSEVEQLILESLYLQKVNPDDARKIASELVDDIEAEIKRRNLVEGACDDFEPPAPPAEVAKNQISDYLRQLAEAKGLDAKEVELVETVLARKQSELSKLGRHDTQTSSMEITDEDLKYSGAEFDMSPCESHANILEEQIEQLEYESKASDLKEKSSIDEVKFSEKTSDSKFQDIYAHQDSKHYENDVLISVKTETAGTVLNKMQEGKDILKKSEQITEDKNVTEKCEETTVKSLNYLEKTALSTDVDIKTDTNTYLEKVTTNIADNKNEEHIEKSSSTKRVTDLMQVEEKFSEELDTKNISLEGNKNAHVSTHEKTDQGTVVTQKYVTTKALGNLEEEMQNKIEHKHETFISDDGSQIICEEIREKLRSKTVSTSQVVDHVREERTSVRYVPENMEENKFISSDDSKSSTYESIRSPSDQISSSSSPRKDDSDTSNILDKPEVILRKKLHKDIETSSSSGNLRIDNRKSGGDFEAYSSSGESHYHSFEQDSARSRPCSSDVEGLIAAGSSEYESALTSQDISSKSHITSTEYHTAISSISSQSMKSLDSESSGNLASIEVSEASETLVASEVPSNFDLEGDILDCAMSQLLEDDLIDSATNEVVEPYDREIPEHVIRGEYPIRDKKSSFDTISDSDIHGESMDMSEEDLPHEKNLPGEVTGKMKRSQEMTFQPIPKAIIPDSPQSDALEMDERFGTSLEDGSVLSMSLSSQSDATALRTVIEQSLKDSERLDGSITISGHDSISASNISLDKIAPLTSSLIDSSTSTGAHGQESLSSVTLTTSTIDENGTQSVSTQVTSKSNIQQEDVFNGQAQVDYLPEYDDVVEPKKVRGHRRQESTSFVPSMIPGFIPRTDILKNTESKLPETEKQITEMTLKEVHHEETKDVDETEESYETEADQGYYRQQQESGILDTESDQDADKDENDSRPNSRISKTDSEIERGVSTGISEDKPDSELIALMNQVSVDVFSEPMERPLTPEPTLDSRGSTDGIPSLPTTPKSKICGSEKSSIEEGEAEAVFSMVAHISPAHKAKGDICPILEDEDAEKHELETREQAQKELEKKRAQILKDKSPGNIPDIMVTEHMTPLVDREFHYPDLELEEKEALAKSAPQTPASIDSKSSEETDQGKEYILDDSQQVICEEIIAKSGTEDIQMIKPKIEITQSKTIEEKTIYEPEAKEPGSPADSPNSDSFEMLEKPDIIDDFVVIEEVAKEAAEHDEEGKGVSIQQTKYIRKHDEEVEEYLVKSAPTPLTRMTDMKYFPDGATSGDELGPFDFDDSPPQAGKKTTGVKTTKADANAAQSYGVEYDRELEASKKWIEMQFQGDQAAMISAGYGYEMEFERGPLEDIKEEEATDFESSRIGSLDSQKQSIGSLGSVKDSFSSTPEYDVLAGRKFFTRSGEHDDVSMSSLQEFEHLERVISLENRRPHQGSQDSSSNGSFSKRYQASKSGQGDDISMSSLKEFEGLETACIEAHKIEVKADEEEALLTQIDEVQETLISESESCKSLSSTDKKIIPESEEEDYEKRMFEIDEIIKQAQSNVEKFIDMKELVDKTESMGRGDSLEEVAKVPDLELDEPLIKSTVHTTKWATSDVMQTSTDSLEEKAEHRTSIDSLDIKTTGVDIMTASTDSIEFQMQSKATKDNLMTDSIDIPDPDRSCMITSDSLELTPGSLAQLGQTSDSIDEDGSRIGAICHDQSSSSGFSISKDEQDMLDHRADYLLGSTDSLDPSSSTATHATYQYETDSVMSGSFTSGGSNTMMSSTDTIDPITGQAHGIDLAAAVRKVWFDEDAFGTGTHFTTELLDDGSKPYVTEVIEPCEGDEEYSHTIHRKVQLPAEIKKITFKGPDADLQLRQYIENFGEGEDVQETEETDKDGNIHVKRVVQKRFIVKSDPSGEEKRISGPELESYLQQVSQSGDQFDLSYRNPSEYGLTKQTLTDCDNTKTIHEQKISSKYFEGQEESTLKHRLSSIASDVTTQSSSYLEQTFMRHVDKQQEQPTGSTSGTFSGAAAANVLRAQGSRRKPLRFDISVDDQTEVDPREHDWRFILPRHDETNPDEKPEISDSSQGTPQHSGVSDQHQLSSEMKELLEEMEKQSKQ